VAQDGPKLDAVSPQMGAAAETYAFPLLPAQERIFLADERRPGNAAYNASFRWNLHGQLNTGVLERSFNEIVGRHEILRATFARVNRSSAQIILPALNLRVAVTDLRSIPEQERAQEMDRLCTLEARRSFALKDGPLIRVGLLCMNNQHHVLMLTLHHIISDGWSVNLIMEELPKIYSAFVASQPSPLSELPIQYADYVEWQQKRIADGAFAPQLTYWKEKLAGYRPLEVKTDFPRSVNRTTNSSIVSMMLPRSLTDALKSFSNRQEGTLFMTALSACMVLLRQYTGEADIAVGSPVAGRNQTDVENLIGLFVNHLIFRVAMSGDFTFVQFETAVRNTVLEAFANQEVPFEMVVEAVREIDDGRNELFYPINFICQREYARASTFVFEFSGLRMTTMPSKSQGALYDLNFFMVERADGWRLSIEYNSDLYREATTQRLLDDFQNLLEGIAEDPNKKISELALPVGRLRSNSTTAVGAVNLVSAPETAPVSVSSDGPSQADQAYSLPASRSQIQFWLLAKADPENSAYHMPACVRLSGLVSVPILRKSLQVLTDRHEILRTTFVERNDELLQIISINQEVSLSITSLEELPAADRELRLQNVLLEEAKHRFDLIEGPLCRARLIRLRGNEHVLVITLHHIIADGWSQNIFQNELWTTYKALVDGQHSPLGPLAIQYGDYTVWQREWLGSDQAHEDLAFWKKQLSGPLPVLDLVADRSPSVRSGSQGAIETLLLPKDLVIASKGLSQPEGSTSFMLLFACFAVLLHCYSKESDILVGSPAANRRSETEALIGPFAAPIALRLNLSGNPTLREVLRRARDTTTDALAHSEFPFSILLDELKVRSIRGRNPLFQFYFLFQTAFLQPRTLGSLDVAPLPTFGIGTPFELQLAVIERNEGIRAQLEYNSDLFDTATARKILSNYQAMLATFVENPDRRIADLESVFFGADRSRSHAVSRAKSEYVPPRNSDELLLTQIWEKVLERSPIGVLDNFFDLGGYSLLAARLVSDVKKHFDVAIDLSTLIIAPTITQLALHLKGQNQVSHLVPLRTAGAKLPLFCIHGGGGHVLAYRELANQLPPDQPIYGLRASALEDAKVIPTVQELAADYLRDIREVQKHGPYQLCGMSFGGLVAYEMANMLVGEGESVGVIALFDTGNPAHYRDLPVSKLISFYITYLADRLLKYFRNLIGGQIGELSKDARKFLKRNLQAFFWMILRGSGRITGLSMHKYVRENVILFGPVGRAYTPQPYSGRLVLFRAEGRTAEYGDDMALGWNDVAQGGIQIHTTPGSHLSLMEIPNVCILAKYLTTYLAVGPMVKLCKPENEMVRRDEVAGCHTSG
jgi:non-ribosomal peptide synthetase component F/thioesterase domain-containing protein